MIFVKCWPGAVRGADRVAQLCIEGNVSGFTGALRRQGNRIDLKVEWWLAGSDGWKCGRRDAPTSGGGATPRGLRVPSDHGPDVIRGGVAQKNAALEGRR